MFQPKRMKRALRGLKALLGAEASRGRCPVCRKHTLFIPLGDWHREDLKCLLCRSSARNRALVLYLEEALGGVADKSLYEPAPYGSSCSYFKQHARRYSTSHYFPQLEEQKSVAGHGNENLEDLSFPDEQFDLVVTQDVFEHILKPSKAFSEIARVLKPGGAHVFTIPWHPDRKTLTRALAEGGKVEYLAPPEFHGSPTDTEGSLVATDFGCDLADIILASSGLRTTATAMHSKVHGVPENGIFVFHSQKPQRN